MKFFQVYPKAWSSDTLQIRIWRTRLYVNRLGWWGNWCFQFRIGLSNGWPEIGVQLLSHNFVLVSWSHKDDCDCNKCLPF